MKSSQEDKIASEDIGKHYATFLGESQHLLS